MKQKKFLTEADRKKAISEKEKAILENFAKTFNKIKRIDENEINEEFDFLSYVESKISEVIREDDGPNAKSLTLKFVDGSEMYLFQNMTMGKRFSIPKKFENHQYEAYYLYSSLNNNASKFWDVYKKFDSMAKDASIDENEINEYEEDNELYSRSVQHGINPYSQEDFNDIPSFDEINWDASDYEIDEIIDPPYTAYGTVFGELNGKNYSVGATLSNVGGGDWEVSEYDEDTVNEIN